MDLAASIVIGLTFAGAAIIALPSLAVEWAKRSTPEVVFSVDTDERIVALTIDDGPSAATSELLAVLDEHGAQATFFLIGEHVEGRPGLARNIVEAGHEVGHHMMQDHPSKDLAEDVFLDRFEEMDRLLDGLGGSRVFRPGSGWYDDRMVRTAGERGYRTVLGSVYPFDAHLSWPGFVSWYVLQHTGPGSILVLHDGPERGLRTVEVLRSVLPELDRRGYRVVTVSHLLALEAGTEDVTRVRRPGLPAPPSPQTKSPADDTEPPQGPPVPSRDTMTGSGF
jgi:peptidoglycan-N-acetylglucosamine deacetylase